MKKILLVVIFGLLVSSCGPSRVLVVKDTCRPHKQVKAVEECDEFKK